MKANRRAAEWYFRKRSKFKLKTAILTFIILTIYATHSSSTWAMRFQSQYRTPYQQNWQQLSSTGIQQQQLPQQEQEDLQQQSEAQPEEPESDQQLEENQQTSPAPAPAQTANSADFMNYLIQNNRLLNNRGSRSRMKAPSQSLAQTNLGSTLGENFVDGINQDDEMIPGQEELSSEELEEIEKQANKEAGIDATAAESASTSTKEEKVQEKETKNKKEGEEQGAGTATEVEKKEEKKEEKRVQEEQPPKNNDKKANDSENLNVIKQEDTKQKPPATNSSSQTSLADQQQQLKTSTAMATESAVKEIKNPAANSTNVSEQMKQNQTTTTMSATANPNSPTTKDFSANDTVKVNPTLINKQIQANSENPYDKQFAQDLQRMEEDPLIFKEEEEKNSLSSQNKSTSFSNFSSLNSTSIKKVATNSTSKNVVSKKNEEVKGKKESGGGGKSGAVTASAAMVQKPQEHQLTLQDQNNIETSPQSQRMDQILAKARQNHELSQKLESQQSQQESEVGAKISAPAQFPQQTASGSAPAPAPKPKYKGFKYYKQLLAPPSLQQAALRGGQQQQQQMILPPPDLSQIYGGPPSALYPPAPPPPQPPMQFPSQNPNPFLGQAPPPQFFDQPPPPPYPFDFGENAMQIQQNPYNGELGGLNSVPGAAPAAATWPMDQMIQQQDPMDQPLYIYQNDTGLPPQPQQMMFQKDPLNSDIDLSSMSANGGQDAFYTSQQDDQNLYGGPQQWPSQPSQFQQQPPYTIQQQQQFDQQQSQAYFDPTSQQWSPATNSPYSPPPPPNSSPYQLAQYAQRQAAEALPDSTIMQQVLQEQALQDRLQSNIVGGNRGPLPSLPSSRMSPGYQGGAVATTSGAPPTGLQVVFNRSSNAAVATSMGSKSQPNQAQNPVQPTADDFDRGWEKDASSGLSVNLGKDGSGKQVQHTFFGGDNDDKSQSSLGMNMLVSEQKQIEKMQAYNFQQFKQIQKMMIQMQKSQQWSFNNIQNEVEEIQKKMLTERSDQERRTQELERKIEGMQFNQGGNNASSTLKGALNLPSSKVKGMNCTNVFYCQNGVNCTEISVCKKNDTCSLIEKCDQATGLCSSQDMCKPMRSLAEQNKTAQVNQNQTTNASTHSNETLNQTTATNKTGNQTANESQGNKTQQPEEAPPVQTKTPEEIKEAKDRLDQLRSHLDVTALFLGQDNVGKILAKLEMDAADPPIPQSKMGELFQKCQKEVDAFIQKEQDKQTTEEKEQDKRDQDESTYYEQYSESNAPKPPANGTNSSASPSNH